MSEERFKRNESLFEEAVNLTKAIRNDFYSKSRNLCLIGDKNTHWRKKDAKECKR